MTPAAVRPTVSGDLLRRRSGRDHRQRTNGDGGRHDPYHRSTGGAMDLIKVLWKYLIAEGEEDGHKVYHFLLADGDVLEIVI